jgi:hypothetical protein
MIGSTAAANARQYDWATWLMGIFRSLIGGGAGAVSGAFGPMLTDPKDFNLGGGIGHTMETMGIGFVIGGIVNMCIFLQTHGSPDRLTDTLNTAGAAAKQAQAAAGAAVQAVETAKAIAPETKRTDE